MGAGLRDIGPKEVLSKPISNAFSGNADTDIIPLVAGKKIVVIGFFFTVSGAVTLQFFNGASSETNPLTGLMTVNANGWIKGNYNPDGHFTTSSGKALVMESGNSVNVGGWINYYLE
tara:strand:- start:617 stop:967 length:351 start_codon:yes stop_codon:yes gene_type:complete